MNPIRAILALVLAFDLLAAPSAPAQTVTTKRDVVYPSGGSRAPRVLSGGGETTIDLSRIGNADPGPEPLSLMAGPLTPSASLTFTGQIQTPSIDGGFTYKPPDTHHAVGTGLGAAGRIVHVTNRGVVIFDKTGSTIAGPLDLDAFLTGLGAAGLSAIGASNLAFDPKVIFDQHSGRFFIVMIDGRTPTGGSARNNVWICTSKTSTPGDLTTTSWSAEGASAITVFTGGTAWFDYPGIGVDATRLVVTGNMFAGGFVGTKVRVFLKSSLTDDGAPAGATFNDIDVDETLSMGGGSGGYATAQPAHVFGSTQNGDFYLVNRFSSSFYRLWQITGAGGSATLVSVTLNAWTAGGSPGGGAPQITDGFNDEPTLDTLATRVQNAVYRQVTAGDPSIWCTLTADPDSDGQSEVVWFEIDPNTTDSVTAGVATSASVIQSGYLDGSTASDWTYLPSISVNGSGDAMICYTESNSTKAAQMRAAARFVSDTPGSFQAPTVIASGAGEYDDFGTSSLERWGDYSGCVVDPDDDETFWVSHEICETAATLSGNDASWGTRISAMGMVVPVELVRFSVE